VAVEDNGRVLGTVQWFSRVKGYGFIRPDGDEEDVFIHYSLIRGEGYRNLSRGQRVEFTMEDTPKGPQAVDVVGLETDAELAEGEGVVESAAEPGLDMGMSVAGFEADIQYGAGEAEY
jgi:CspA family cold shock protein